MHLRKLLMVMGCAVGMAACAPKKNVVVAAPPATTDQLEIIRAGYQKVDPNARVGRISAVLPNDRLVAVTDILPTEFHENEPFTIIDSKGNLLTTGKVVNITPHAVHISYVAPAAGGRDPRVGDLAVHVSPTPVYHPAP